MNFQSQPDPFERLAAELQMFIEELRLNRQMHAKIRCMMDNQAYSQNLGFAEIPLPDTSVPPPVVRAPALAHPISNHTPGEPTSQFFNSNILPGPMNNHGKAPRENNLRSQQSKSSDILVPKPTRQSDKKIHYDYILDSDKYQPIRDNIKTKLSNVQVNTMDKTIETTTTPPRNVPPSVVFSC